LARARWGHTRTDRLVAELRERRAELVTEQVDVLRELVDEADHNDDEGDAA